MKKEKVFSILKKTLSLLLCAIIVIIAASILISVIKQKPLPTVFGFGASVVLTGSMEPELSVDDVVIFKETDSIKVKDIVLYETDGTTVVHRVFEVLDNGQTIVTKGDANNAKDLPINKSQVIGKVVGSVPVIGIFIKFFQSIYGIITLILIGVVIYTAIYIFKQYKSEKENKTEECP